jgi:VanZ family protein
MGLSRTAVFSFRLALAAALPVITHIATAPLAYPMLKGINDKAGHLSAFFVLAFLVDFSFPGSRFGRSKVLALFGYGLLIEVLQHFLPYRDFSLLDLAADGAGIALYLLALPALRHLPVLRRRWRTG